MSVRGSTHKSDIMKVLVALVLLVAVAQAKWVKNLDDLEFRQVYVTPDPSHTAEEWDAIYAAAEAIIPENTTGLVLGTEPQPEDAGKVYVEPAGRIITGTQASEGQIPWQALLIIGGNSLCGGSLISREWVLTAAHCVPGASTIHVTLGSVTRTGAGGVTQESRQHVVHANYNSRTNVNDIAAVKLSSAVTLNNHINVVRLPHNEASNTFAGHAAMVSGFGRINSNNQATSSHLLYANVEIITNAVCARTLGSIQSSNICTTGADGRSPCNGDSGGPLVVRESDGRYTLVGAVSFGIQNCPAGRPAAYARITSFLSWISSTTGVALRS